jgi:hypothetical protein
VFSLLLAGNGIDKTMLSSISRAISYYLFLKSAFASQYRLFGDNLDSYTVFEGLEFFLAVVLLPNI